jgi:hypothetical protein
MKLLETKTIINASAAQVWKVLTTFEKYHEWNPFIIRLSGNAEVGEHIEVHLKMEGSKAQVFRPDVLVVAQDREFRWRGKLFVKGLFDGEHYFLLNPLSDGRTEFIHGEQFSGMLVRPIMHLIGDSTANAFHTMNAALKKSVEQTGNR